MDNIGIWGGGTHVDRDYESDQQKMAQKRKQGLILKSKILKLQKQAREKRGIITGLICPPEKREEVLEISKNDLESMLNQITELKIQLEKLQN